MEGKKYDQDKVRFDLIEPYFLENLAKVLTGGAKKYEEDSWRRVPQARKRYLAAALRHLNKYRQGKAYDEESGLPHLSHLACNIMFLHILTEGDANEINNLRRRGSEDASADGESGESGDVSREADAEQDYKYAMRRHFEKLTSLLDAGRSSECIRACVDDLRLKWSVKELSRADNAAQNE